METWTICLVEFDGEAPVFTYPGPVPRIGEAIEDDTTGAVRRWRVVEVSYRAHMSPTLGRGKFDCVFVNVNRVKG